MESTILEMLMSYINTWGFTKEIQIQISNFCVYPWSLANVDIVVSPEGQRVNSDWLKIVNPTNGK